MDARSFSGIIVVQAKIDRANTLVILHELLQGLVGHASKGKIAVILPVLRKEIDEGQKVDRRFEDTHLIVLSLMTEAISLI